MFQHLRRRITSAASTRIADVKPAEEAARARTSAQTRPFEPTNTGARHNTPEVLESRPMLDLTAGYVQDAGVVIVRVKMAPDAPGVVIQNARGAMVGDHNRQLNEFSYQLLEPQVSIDEFLEGSRTQQKELERLLADPDNRAANHAFRQRLGRNLPIIQGGARFVQQPTRGRRITARVGPMGGVTIHGSRGVMIGDRNTQRNAFHLRVERPRLSLSAVMRDKPNLIRAMARAIREPHDAAAQKVFQGQLTNAFQLPGKRTGFLADRVHGQARSIVTNGYGVMLGRHNTRVDRVTTRLGRITLAKDLGRWRRLMPSVPESPASRAMSADQTNASRAKMRRRSSFRDLERSRAALSPAPSDTRGRTVPSDNRERMRTEEYPLPPTSRARDRGFDRGGR